MFSEKKEVRKMKKQEKSILVLAAISFITFTMVFFGVVSVGSSDDCNSSRFECVMGGEAVLDKKTGLTWARNANIAAGTKLWLEAMEFCQDLEIGNRKGWRLPTKEELSGMLGRQGSDSSLPDGHPFEDVQEQYRWYWSSTEDEGRISRVWVVNAVGMHDPKVRDKTFEASVWPVLGGN
jgi:hypothetical protein